MPFRYAPGGPSRCARLQVFDPLDFISEITQHIPNKGEHTIRYYGFYSNKAERWVDWFNNWDEDTCSTDGRMYPIIPVHGNHENPNGMKDLVSFFDTPGTFYYINFCDNFMRILVLNTEFLGKGVAKVDPDASKQWAVQTKWLEESLKNSSKFLIRTVMTENESEVESLKESEELTLPKGIKLFDTPGMGTTINYPFKK